MLTIKIPKSCRTHVWYLTTIVILSLWVVMVIRTNNILHEEIAARDRTMVVTVRVLDNRIQALTNRINLLQRERDKLLLLWKHMRKEPEVRVFDDDSF